MIQIFDLYDYMEKLSKANKLASDNQFAFCRVSGIMGLQEVLQNQRKGNNFIAVDDFTVGKIFNNGTGFFTRYIFTIFLFARFDQRLMNDRIDKLNLCRTLRSQIYSKFIIDRNKNNIIRYINTNEAVFHEFTGTQLNGCTGTFFEINVDVPTNLCFNKDEWNE